MEKVVSDCTRSRTASGADRRHAENGSRMLDGSRMLGERRVFRTGDRSVVHVSRSCRFWNGISWTVKHVPSRSRESLAIFCWRAGVRAEAASRTPRPTHMWATPKRANNIEKIGEFSSFPFDMSLLSIVMSKTGAKPIYNFNKKRFHFHMWSLISPVSLLRYPIWGFFHSRDLFPSSPMPSFHGSFPGVCRCPETEQRDLLMRVNVVTVDVTSLPLSCSFWGPQ